jgi:hypothetical protein
MSARDGKTQLPAERRQTVLLLAALAAALSFRLYLLIAQDFPINDGALFFEFIRATAATFPSLPTEAAYNGLLLPFAYPPLSFWLGALLTKMGFDSLAVVRVLPILMNIAYLLLFALLLLKSGRSRAFTALAVLLLAVNLRSFEWLLMGGGLTRGLGSVFLVLALLAVTIPDSKRCVEPSRLRMVLAGAAVGGAILSHLEWGILAAASVVLSRALASKDIKEFVTSSTLAGLTALALVVPWVLFVHQAHGWDPFLAASGTSGWKLGFVKGRMLGIASMAVASNPLVLVGGVVMLVRRQWFWIGFILACVILTPRHAQTPAMLAVAVFGAQGIMTAVEFAGRFIQSRKLLAASSFGLVAALLAVNLYRTQLHAPVSFRALPLEVRQSMAWVKEHHPGARFAIINDRHWPNDSTGEWFPTLASARSVTTVQGREWNGQYSKWEDLSRDLRTSSDCESLKGNVRRFGSFDFLLVETNQDCFAALEGHRIYSNRAVSIYGAPDAQGLPGPPLGGPKQLTNSSIGRSKAGSKGRNIDPALAVASGERGRTLTAEHPTLELAD